MVTNTVCAPTGAFTVIVNVAVIVVGLVTATLCAVIPVPLNVMLAGAKKFNPVSVIVGVVVPAMPLAGLNMDSMGWATTVKP